MYVHVCMYVCNMHVCCMYEHACILHTYMHIQEKEIESEIESESESETEKERGTLTHAEAKQSLLLLVHVGVCGHALRRHQLLQRRVSWQARFKV